MHFETSFERQLVQRDGETRDAYLNRMQALSDAKHEISRMLDELARIAFAESRQASKILRPPRIPPTPEEEAAYKAWVEAHRGRFEEIRQQSFGDWELTADLAENIWRMIRDREY